MKTLFSIPRLPNTTAKLVLISGEYPVFAQKLRKMQIEAVKTERDSRLPPPVAFHPDMQACILSKEIMFVLRRSPLVQKLSGYGIYPEETEREPGNVYPADVLCNAFVWNKFLFGNLPVLDGRLRRASKQLGYREIFVRQGYAACSVALVNEKAAITSDRGIAKALRQFGADVLEIQPGHIELPGYSAGFIGGCCGKLSPGLMAFSGSLESHPDGLRIKSFLTDRGIKTVELSSDRLLDIGGIIPLQ